MDWKHDKAVILMLQLFLAAEAFQVQYTQYNSHAFLPFALF